MTAIQLSVGERRLRREARRAVSPLSRRRRTIGTIIGLPALALVVGVLWYPVGQEIYYAFTDWNGVTAHWTGLANYQSIVGSPQFRQVLMNNVLLLTSLPVLVLGPLAMALALSRIGRGRGLLRTLLFVPVPLSSTVVGIAGTYVFAQRGPFNALLRGTGLGALATDWVSQDASAKVALILVIVWALFGLNFLIYQSAISAFDETLYDAARVDGAGPVRTFFSVVLPVLSPFVRFVAIYSATLLYAAMFAIIYVFTGGGPGFSTTTLEFFTYYQGFHAGEFALAAASGTFLFLVIFLINVPQLRRFVRSA